MSYTFTSEGAPEGEFVVICDRCGGHVCTVEDGDDLEIVMQTALDHGDDCDAPASSRERP